jgi:hypothetical protein
MRVEGTVSADVSDYIYTTNESTLGGKQTREVDMKEVRVGNDFYIINDGQVDLKLQFNDTASDIQTVKPDENFRDDFFRFQSVFVTNPANTTGEYRIRINGV